jgi:hypothetical protein
MRQHVTLSFLVLRADLFEPRKDAPADVPRRETAIYLYGVDVMSSSDVLAYFDEYGPSLVEWINDSSCEWRANVPVSGHLAAAVVDAWAVGCAGRAWQPGCKPLLGSRPSVLYSLNRCAHMHCFL